MNKRKSRCPHRGFSLVELLSVIAVISVMVTASLPAISSISKARRLSTAGNLVYDLSSQARQNAMSRNAMTALVLNKSTGSFILMELLPGKSTWSPISRWYDLPEGIAVDEEASGSFMSSPGLAYPLGNLTRGKNAVSEAECVYQVFLPRGQLVQNSGETPPILQLVEKYSGGKSNYYKVFINQFTGIAGALHSL